MGEGAHGARTAQGVVLPLTPLHPPVTTKTEESTLQTQTYSAEQEEVLTLRAQGAA